MRFGNPTGDSCENDGDLTSRLSALKPVRAVDGQSSPLIALLPGKPTPWPPRIPSPPILVLLLADLDPMAILKEFVL